MYCVYLIRSKINLEKRYVGFTSNLGQRLEEHNAGKSFHTADFRPWHLVAYFSFDSKLKALNFEKYLKSGAGNAFAHKRFW
jgi:predicted GIY-YIG superfamily endonuclease